MGKSQKAPPAAATPDPTKVATDEARLNRLDVFSPDQNVRHGYSVGNTFVAGQVPAGRQAAVQVTDTPFQQQLRNKIEPTGLRFADQIIADNQTIPGRATVGDRDQISSQIFDRAYSLLEPSFQQQDDRHFNNLQARGLPIGGAAANEHFGNVQREREDMLGRLAMDADVASGQEQSRQFSLDSAERNSSLGELAQLLGGNFSPTTTSSVGVGNASPVNISNLTAQNAANANSRDLANQQANAQALSTGASLLGTLGAAAIFSDRRLKTDVLHVGETPAGTKVYSYRYVWDDPVVSRIGVMSDEVSPDAVIEHESGFDMVDYRKVA